MRRYYEQLKKVYRLLSSCILIFLATFAFIQVWARRYNAMIVFPYYFKGFLMMAAMYAFLIAFFSWLFDGSQIGYMNRRNALISETLSVVCTNVLFYLLTVLLATFFVPIWGFLFLTIGDIAVLLFLTEFLNHIFDKVFPPIQILLIYGDYPATEIRRMTSNWNGKYQIADSIGITAGRSKVIKKIKKYDAVAICDIPVSDRNVIAEYCANHQIPTYFTPKISDILFKNAEGLRFFDGGGNHGLSVEQKFSLIGYLKKIYRGGRGRLYELVNTALDEQGKMFLITANPETLMMGLDIPEFDAVLLDENTTIVPDGIGIVKALQLVGYGKNKRIPGVEFTDLMLKLADIKGKSVYFYGASQEVVETLAEKTREKYPHAVIAGYQDGYERDADEVMKEIVASQPDIVLVALGVPAQELLIAKYYHEFAKGIFIGVGGSFDVLSGTKKRAPEIFLKLNLEWLYRICREPKRLKRFWNSNVRFLWEVMKIQKIK